MEKRHKKKKFRCKGKKEDNYPAYSKILYLYIKTNIRKHTYTHSYTCQNTDLWINKIHKETMEAHLVSEMQWVSFRVGDIRLCCDRST